MERTDLLHTVCKADKSIPDGQFIQKVCSQCSQPKCTRSTYHDSATQKKIQKHEKLLEYVDPGEFPQSPLAHYPDEEVDENGHVVHRADVPGTVEDAGNIDQSIQDLATVLGAPVPVQETSTSGPPSKPGVSTEQTVPQRHRDPWAVPSKKRVNIHKEYTNPEEDPWSASYQGRIEKSIKPGATVRLPGRGR